MTQLEFPMSSKDRALETLGTIIGPNEQRDAVHVAVIGVVATESLRPGEKISVIGTRLAERDEPNAVVDPFLQQAVQKGEYFWAFMNPRRITDLRHAWSHPDVLDEGQAPPPPVEPDPDQLTMENVFDALAGHPQAMEVLKETAKDAEMPVGKLIKAATKYQETGDYLTFDEDVYPELADPEGFWSAWEKVTGKKADIKADEGRRGHFFRCGC